MVLIKYLFNNVSQFLDGQYDYTYFFYGLSFFFLSLVCFNIERNKFYKLPWRLLGGFALTHGVGEWMELLSIMLGPQAVLMVLHPAFLGVSYFFLFEFARVGYLRLEKKPLVHWWVYIPLFVMVFIGAQSAVDGLNISLRYFLGFPAGILAAFVVYRKSRVTAEARNRLIAFSVLLAAYALLTGLVVKENDFLIAAHLNSTTFYNFVGIPVQFIRGLLVLSSAMVLWFYSPVFSYSEQQTFRYRLSLKLSHWAVVWVISILLLLGLALTNFLDYYANVQLIRTGKDIRHTPLGRLLEELAVLEKVSISLSKTPAIKSAVISNERLEDAQAILLKQLEKYDLRSCYAVASDGEVIAYAGEKLPEKYAATPYISRLYFHQAFSDDAGYHITPVSGNRERIYSVSYAIRDDNGEIRGFVILSKIIGVKLLLQYRMMGILLTMFISILVLAIFIYLRKREALIEFMDSVNARLKEVDQLKTDFISIVSHDLRTPLTAISNAVMILHKSKLKSGFADPYEQELIEIIAKNTERQRRMIADLLDVSKIEAGVLPIDIGYHDLNMLAKEMIRTFQPQAEEKEITIETVLEDGKVIVPVDEDYVRRIFGNLLSNAIRYGRIKGRVTVRVEPGRDEVIVSVANDGPIIPKVKAEKLFSKFYQSKDEIGTQKGGSGLGLFITKGLVEAHGGTVWFDSREGRETVFYFSLPKWRANSSQT